MDERKFNTAAWVTIIFAVISILLQGVLTYWSLLGVQISMFPFGAKVVFLLLEIISIAVYIFIFLTFKYLLNKHFKFHQVDSYITLMIIGGIALSLVSLLWVIPQFEKPLSIITALIVIPFGIICAVFGIKLLQLPDDLYGMLRPLSYVTIGEGFCWGTVVLSPIGIILSAVSSILLGMIFFKAAAQNIQPRLGNQAVRFCDNCGNSLEEGEKFCTSCGQRI
jgi:hypothetical protein